MSAPSWRGASIVGTAALASGAVVFTGWTRAGPAAPGLLHWDVPTHQTLLAFALVSAGIMLIPGPSNLFLLAHGIAHGRRAALAAAGGVETASAVRVLLTAAGLSALLASTAIVFDLIKWAGVAYLIYLGVQALRSHPADTPHNTTTRPIRVATSLRQGLLVGLGNPKMVIFYLAFFPQFIDPRQASETLQILVLGSVFWTIGAAWDLAFACASGSVGSWMRARPRVQAAQPKLEGLTYFGLAGWAALTGGAHAS